MEKANENKNQYNPQDDVEFHRQAMDIAMSMGLTEMEAEYELDDYLSMF